MEVDDEACGGPGVPASGSEMAVPLAPVVKKYPKKFDILSPLSAEMRRKILGHSGTFQARWIQAWVSEKWRSAVNDPGLWRDRVLAFGPDVPSAFVRRVVSVFSDGLDSVLLAEDEILEADRSLELLEELALKKTHLSSLKFQLQYLRNGVIPLMAKALDYASANPHLRRLSIESSFDHPETDESYDSLRDTSENKLRELRLKTDLQEGRILTWILSRSPNLELLLFRLPFDLEQDQEVYDVLDELDNLKAVYLERFIGWSPKKIEGLLCNHPNLQAVALCLEGTRAKDPPASEVPVMDNLKYLCFHGTERRRSDKGVKFSHLRFLFQPDRVGFPFLEKFVAEFIELLDEDVELIAVNCPNLKFFGAHSCNVGDAGVSKLIENCGDLRVLAVRDSPRLTGRGWMKGPLGLELLDVSGCNKVDTVALRLLSADCHCVGPSGELWRRERHYMDVDFLSEGQKEYLYETHPNLRDIEAGRIVPDRILEYSDRLSIGDGAGARVRVLRDS